MMVFILQYMISWKHICTRNNTVNIFIINVIILKISLIKLNLRRKRSKAKEKAFLECKLPREK